MVFMALLTLLGSRFAKVISAPGCVSVIGAAAVMPTSMASAIKIFAVLMAVKVKLLWLGNSVLKGGMISI